MALEAPAYSDVAPCRDAASRRRRDTSASDATALCAWLSGGTVHTADTFKVDVLVKNLDGSPATGRAVVVLDQDGTAVGRADLAEGECDASAQGTPSRVEITVTAPRLPGHYTWQVAVAADGRHRGNSRHVSFSVALPPGRRATLRLLDARSGKPVKDAAAYFYDTKNGGSPIAAEDDGQGTVVADIAADVPYEVRVEATGYHEARDWITAGSEPAERNVTLESTLWDGIVLGRGGYDQF